MQENLPGIETEPRGRKALGNIHRRHAESVIVGDMPSGPERKPLKISFETMANAYIRPHTPQRPLIENPFLPYEPLPGVLPEGKTAAMAMDDAGFGAVAGWAGEGAGGWMGSSIYAEGQTFLGYSTLSLLAQRPEYRVVSETLADEATRKWIKIKAKNEGEDKSEKIKRIENEFERLDVRGHFRKTAEYDGFMGRGHIYLDTGDTDDKNELTTNLGDSFSTVSRGKVSPERPLRGIRTIEAMWCYPNMYNSTNPLKKDWYRPNTWFVMGQQIHTSRLLTFVAREVPDILKPAYCFGGLSLSQMIKPYVDNWLTTRQAVQDILTSFSVFVLKTNMASVLSGVGGDDFFKRLDMFNATRSNRGLMALDKDTEEFQNVSAPLSTLDHLQAQSLEHIASCSKIPLVKLTGISPSGLNASSEGELRCWEDNVHSYQEAFFRPNLEVIFNFVQLSLFGEIDPGLTFDFLPINELTEKEAAELRQIEAQTDQVLVELGAISQQEVRQRVAMDPDAPYAGLDVDDMPEMPGEHLDSIEQMFGGTEEPGAEAPQENERGLPDFAPHSKPPHKTIGLGGNASSEGGFRPAHDCFAHDDELSEDTKPKRARKRKSDVAPEAE